MLLNGVRASGRGFRCNHASSFGEERMTLTLRDSMNLVSDPGNLDASVHEVFETMLGVQCRRDPLDPIFGEGISQEFVTAVVGFGGILSGACVFRCDAPAACRIAARLAGMEFDSLDDIVKDAMGEICNMLAGSWKTKVPDLAANCGLSVPAVITGRDYELHVPAPEFRICHAYVFDGVRFETSIVCDSLQ
jgi:chemotaxis protein CheX